MEFETVRKTFSPVEAALICSRLRAAGFDAEVVDELAALGTEGYSLATGGIRIHVPAPQGADARTFLASEEPLQP
jgi:hypothetical protein